MVNFTGTRCHNPRPTESAPQHLRLWVPLLRHVLLQPPHGAALPNLYLSLSSSSIYSMQLCYV